MVVVKVISGGLLGALLAWAGVVVVFYWRTIGIARAKGSGLAAIAGGWDYLIRLPLTLLLLTVGFGLGLFIDNF